MNILLETENEQAATELANEILDDVCGKKVDTWHHCLRAVNGNAEASCIYHFTEKDANDDNKRVKFYVHERGERVCFQQTWREGYTPGRQTKLHLIYALVEMLLQRYPCKFSGIKFEW
jgi:hypothetical protein